MMEFGALCVRQSRSQLQNRNRTDPSLIDECRHELVFPFDHPRGHTYTPESSRLNQRLFFVALSSCCRRRWCARPRREQGTRSEGLPRIEACAAWGRRHRPFVSQGKQDCLCYWKSKGATLDARGAWMAWMCTTGVRARHAVPLLEEN